MGRERLSCRSLAHIVMIDRSFRFFLAILDINLPIVGNLNNEDLHLPVQDAQDWMIQATCLHCCWMSSGSESGASARGFGKRRPRFTVRKASAHHVSV